MSSAATVACLSVIWAHAGVASALVPTGEFARFVNCPLQRTTVTDCVYAVIEGGSLTLGKKTVPILSPLILQGGYEGTGSEIHFFGAANGLTLSRAPQPVPGGLQGIRAPLSWPKAVQEWFNGSIGRGLTAIDATVELAAAPEVIMLDTEHLVFAEGVALGLPIKVHLENPLLGANCYMGSNSAPIHLELTTATTTPPPPNKPIEPSEVEISFNESFTISFAKSELLDNSFAVPQGVSGCGGSYSALVNPLIDALVGLPSPAGHNTAILRASYADGVASVVRASER